MRKVALDELGAGQDYAVSGPKDTSIVAAAVVLTLYTGLDMHQNGFSKLSAHLLVA